MICCHEITDTIREIRYFILSRQENLEGYEAGKQFQIPLPEIYYAEAVDNRLFIYTKEKVYEVKMKLYSELSVLSLKISVYSFVASIWRKSKKAK